MARPRSRIDAVCQNKKCVHYRKTKGKDIIRKGHNSAGTQMYKCLNCNAYFVQTSGTPLYRKRLPASKVKQLYLALVEKNGIRSTARLTGLNPITVTRWHDDLAEHAQQVNEILTHGLGLAEYEVDEFWTTIKKNRKTIGQNTTSLPAKAKHGVTLQSNAIHTSSSVFPSAVGRRKHVRAS